MQKAVFSVAMIPAIKSKMCLWFLHQKCHWVKPRSFFPSISAIFTATRVIHPLPGGLSVTSGPILRGLANASEQMELLSGLESCCPCSCLWGEIYRFCLLFKLAKITSSCFVSFLCAELYLGVLLTKQCRLLCAFVVDWIPLCQQLVLVTLETALHPTEDFDRRILTEITLFSQFCKHTCS